MATLKDINDELAALKLHITTETEQVTAAIADLTAQVKTLRDKIDNGQIISAADLDSTLAAIKDVEAGVDAIYTPPDAEPQSGGGPDDGGNGP